jgi:hypothetical protein
MTVAAAGHGDDHSWEAGGSIMGHASAAMYSIKCWEGTPTDHFKRLLEEVCPNHAYPIRHKLKDCVIMRSFMTSRSLTWGTRLDEGPDRNDATSFPEENAIMTILKGHLPSRSCRKSSLSPRVTTHGGGAYHTQKFQNLVCD